MTTEPINYRTLLFYHHQRTFWPMVAGFAAFLLWHNDLMPGDNAAIPAFITYVATGLFYDWLVFSYLGYKESDRGTPEQWAVGQIKPDEADKLNEFYIMVRRGAFAASVSATAGCYLFFPNMSVMGTLFFAYTGVTIFLISIGILTKEIIFKYTPENVLAPVERNKPFFSATDYMDPLNPLSPMWYHNHSKNDW